MVSAQRLTLDTLPYGARVGTSSLRRSAQLLALRPDLVIAPLRGNVDTRIRKALQSDYDAIILAAAGVQRLGLEDAVTGYLSFERHAAGPRAGCPGGPVPRGRSDPGASAGCRASRAHRGGGER